MWSMGLPFKNLYISCGVAASDLWRSILASSWKKHVNRITVHDGLVIPYHLIRVRSAGTRIEKVTRCPFRSSCAATAGCVPFWLGAAVICTVVLVNVFFGVVRGSAWANAFQTIVFIILGVVTFTLIASELGDPRRLSPARRAALADVFYNPGHATDAAMRHFYRIVGAEQPDGAVAASVSW